MSGCKSTQLIVLVCRLCFCPIFSSHFTQVAKCSEQHQLVTGCLILTCKELIYLTLFYPWGGHYGPPYHESVCHCHMVRATLTKLPDFVPFHVCHLPESQFWCLFFKKLKKFNVENFWGSSSIRRKSENRKILNFFIFLLTNPTFSSSI